MNYFDRLSLAITCHCQAMAVAVAAGPGLTETRETERHVNIASKDAMWLCLKTFASSALSFDIAETTYERIKETWWKQQSVIPSNHSFSSTSFWSIPFCFLVFWVSAFTSPEIWEHFKKTCFVPVTVCSPILQTPQVVRKMRTPSFAYFFCMFR